MFHFSPAPGSLGVWGALRALPCVFLTKILKTTIEKIETIDFWLFTFYFKKYLCRPLLANNPHTTSSHRATKNMDKPLLILSQIKPNSHLPQPKQNNKGLHGAYKIHVCRLKYIFYIDFFSKLRHNLLQHQEAIAVPTTGQWYTFLLERGIPKLDCNSI